jgi:hypothetical protein
VAALDGNAIAGMLEAAFGTEMTTSSGACTGCGRRSLVAELAVYLQGPGTVVRCRHCGGVVMVLVEIREVTCVDLNGLEALEPAV